MRILITGHTGFIGSNLSKRLSNTHEVFGLDITEGQDILNCSLDFDVDLVIHLAGIGGVRESLADPQKYWNTNVEGTKRILNHFKDVRVLVAGSSSGYEPHLNPYAASKNVIEYIEHPNVCFMRFHTVYGPNPRKRMFFDKLLNDQLEYVTEHRRDFIHIEDLMDAIEIIISNDVRGPIDIGRGQNVCIRDIRPDLPVKFDTVGERQETLADIEKLQSLGFKPKYTVEKFLSEQGFDVIGSFVKKEFGNTFKIDFWYDRSLRLWTCLWLDEFGNQHGVAQYASNKVDMKLLVDRMKYTEPSEYQI